METAKQEVRDLLEQLPENASLEDIRYHIYVRQKTQKGWMLKPTGGSSPRPRSSAGWLDGSGSSLGRTRLGRA